MLRFERHDGPTRTRVTSGENPGGTYRAQVTHTRAPHGEKGLTQS